MGWFKKVISVVFTFSFIRPIIWLLTSSPKKIQVPPVAGDGATSEEIAAMKQMEEAHMTEEEKQGKAKNALKLVINGAKIQCTMCTNPIGTLLATNNTPSIQGQPTAISKDKEKVNLIFAGTCLKLPNTPTPCIALIQPGQWQDTGSYNVQGESPLLLKSTIKCMFGGVDIKITDCGQRNSFVFDAPTEMQEDTDENSQMRVALFFDGTKNNMKNTEAREEYFKLHGKRPYEDEKYRAEADKTKAAIYAKVGNKDDDSYENGYSNVALLSKYYKKELRDPENLRDYAYVEGIATGDREHDAYVTDSKDGYMFGIGDTGIKAKVEKGCAFAAGKIDKLNKKGKKLKQITIDVFGFSRGAAAARSFLHELGKMPRAARVRVVSGPQNGSSVKYTEPAIPRYGKLGIELSKLGIDLTECHVIIRFAGLFDTVSSYGIRLSKEKDTQSLGLDGVRLAKNTLHLTAADEHRYFFPLVNINSAGFNEKVFPGVHSDIGGSYVDGDPEIKKGLAAGSESDVIEKYKKLVREGWYTREQLTIVKPSAWQTIMDTWKLKVVTSPVEYIEESMIRLRGEKKSISAAYSYIPLHIMCDYAMKKGIYLKFRNVDLKDELNISQHEKLFDVNKRLYNIVFNNAPEMIFYKRSELEYEIEMARPEGPDFSFHRKNLDWLNDKIPIEPTAGKPIDIEVFIHDKMLIQKIQDHNAILMLRNEYLHRSADWFEPGFNPTKNEKRKIYEG